MTSEECRTTVVRRRQSTLPETWREFHRALRSPYEPFDPFVWIQRLCFGVLDHIYVTTGCIEVVQQYNLHKAWRPLIPLFGVCLVVLIVIAYFGSLRFLVRDRWCSCHLLLQTEEESRSVAVLLEHEEVESDPTQHVCPDCTWIRVHDFLVIYFCIMCLFHYVATIIRSPGVALPEAGGDTSLAQWRPKDGQGGMVGWSPIMHVANERKLVALFGPLQLRRKEETTTTTMDGPHQHSSPVYFPTPDASFCDKCQILRPPRCHHCHTCKRCILQYDHHCIWVNNCIGYNNYRHFVLMLFFFTVACWYGMCMLFYPFYLPLQKLLRQHGWKGLYSEGEGLFLGPPAPHRFIYQLCTGTMTLKTVLNLVYPLFFGVGWLLSGFLAFHIFYILHARTTLEHNIFLDGTIPFMLREQGRPNTPVVNPYNLGYMRNLKQILGPNPLLVFLPLVIEPMPPIVPKIERTR